MKSKRRQFMAPFVVVLGCGGPKRQPEPGPTRPVVAVQPADATSTPDAAPLDADGDQTATPRCYKFSCNPPPPEPTSFPGKVLRVTERDGGLEVIMGARGIDWVNKDWHVVFVGPDGKDIPGTETRVVTSTMRETSIFLPTQAVPSSVVRVFDPTVLRRDYRP